MRVVIDCNVLVSAAKTRNLCEGIGDYNPLWQDAEHAANSRFGMITAPRASSISVSLGVIAGETGAIDRARVSTQYLPVNYAGVEIDFVRPVWLGDDGTLKKLNASVRHPNIVGDTNTLTGSVVKKSVVDGEHLVEVRMQNNNQSGLTTAFGSAIVALPTRG